MSQLSSAPTANLALFCALLMSALAPVQAGVDRWTPIGPDGGEVYAVAADTIHPEILYASTSGGVFRSTDGGKHWAAGTGLRRGGGRIAVSPTRPAVLFATSNEGLFKSVDRGRSWAPAAGAPPLTYVSTVAIDPGQASVVYAGGREGFARSRDGGTTWVLANAGLGADPPRVQEILVNPEAPGELYIRLYSGGVFHSTDQGDSWVPASVGLAGAVTNLALLPGSPPTLFAIAEGIFRSDDGGASWFRIAEGLPISTLALAPSDPRILYGGSPEGVWKSTDGGSTWALTALQPPEAGASPLFVHPSDAATVYATTTSWGGLLRSTDGGASWQAMDQGLMATSVQAVAVAPGPWPKVYASATARYPEGRSFSLVESNEGGGDWQLAGEGLDAGFGRAESTTPLLIHPENPQVRYAGFTDAGEETASGLLRSTDGGRSWSPSLILSYCAMVDALVADPRSPVRLYAWTWTRDRYCDTCPLYRSDDDGESWECLLHSSTGGRTYRFTSVVDPVTGTLYSAEENRMFRSTDGGLTWERRTEPPGRELRLLAFDPSPPSTLYASDREGLYISRDGGASWELTGLRTRYLRTLLIHPTDPDVLYARARAHWTSDRVASVFRSVDRGITWEEMSDGLYPWDLSGGLALDPDHPWILYATTDGAGVYRYTRRTPVPCAPDARTLCLNDGRFRVRVTWRTGRGRQGAGRAVRATGETGFFWFFDADNYELMIKVLDGTGLNGHFWVFYGALSDVQYSIEVMDSATGEVRTYFNPRGEMASRGDTGAFEEAEGEAAEAGEAAPMSRAPAQAGPGPGAPASASTALEELEAPGPAPRQSGPCAATSTALCLQGNRFRVEVAWESFRGHTGSGKTVPLTAETGAFWFFSPNNYELLVKVLDGRGQNGHFWVFYGALSNVGYTVTVTDTTTGRKRTYENPAGTFASVADTEAF